MSLIVDGHNLIPKLPGMSLSMPDDEEQLIRILMEYSRIVNKKLDVFFDNAPLGGVRTKRIALITVHFVREGSSADEAIRAKLRRLRKDAKNWTVVSSDREIQNEARWVGARIISSDEFATLLLDVLNKSVQISSDAREVYPDELEVNHWLKIFGKHGKETKK